LFSGINLIFFYQILTTLKLLLSVCVQYKQWVVLLNFNLNFTVTCHCDFYRSCSNDVYLNQSHLSIPLLSLFTVFLGIIYYKQVHNISSLKNKKNNYFMPLIPSRINSVTFALYWNRYNVLFLPVWTNAMADIISLYDYTPNLQYKKLFSQGSPIVNYLLKGSWKNVLDYETSSN
jgi:hypothetical protein